MTSVQNKTCWSWSGIAAVAAVLITSLALPLSTARPDDDDDWEDRWEDYQEDLEEQREEERERWEEWREDREEALEDWREHGARRGYYYGPGQEYRAYHYPERRYYQYRSSPGYGAYYWEPRPYTTYRYYDHAPRYRYYGTPGVGYTEFGRQRSVQFGPYRVYWDR
jgi:hypothetical protein